MLLRRNLIFQMNFLTGAGLRALGGRICFLPMKRGTEDPWVHSRPTLPSGRSRQIPVLDFFPFSCLLYFAFTFFFTFPLSVSPVLVSFPFFYLCFTLTRSISRESFLSWQPSGWRGLLTNPASPASL